MSGILQLLHCFTPETYTYCALWETAQPCWLSSPLFLRRPDFCCEIILTCIDVNKEDEQCYDELHAIHSIVRAIKMNSMLCIEFSFRQSWEEQGVELWWSLECLPTCNSLILNSIEFTKDITITSVFMLASSVERYITMTGFSVRKVDKSLNPLCCI